jgi:hypothetical protein
MVPPNSLGREGRNVKCAKCSKTWFAKPTEEELKKSEDAVVPPKGGFSLSDDKLPTIRTDNWIAFLKVVPVVLLFLIMLITIVFYKNVLTKIPGINHLYEAVGVYNYDKIVFKDVAVRKIDSRTGKDLVIRGNVLNSSSDLKFVPDLRFVIYDKLGNKILNHTIKSNQKILKPGEKYSIGNTVRNLQNRAEILELDVGNSIDLLVR